MSASVKQTLVEQGFSQPVREYEERLLDVGTKVRYLYEPGELEGYQYKGERRKRSTDPIWSVDVYKIKDRHVQKHQPTLYYLDAGPKRSFVFEELQPIHDPSLLVPTLALVLSALSGSSVVACMHLAYSTFSSTINSFFKTKE